MFAIKKSVISMRFRAVFIASMVSMTSTYILMLTDNVVAGQFIGADAVAAMTLIAPVTMLLAFVGYMIADGLAMMLSYALGRQDRAEANRLFGLGIILSAVCSAIFWAALIFGRDEILSMWDISPQLMTFARDYYGALMWLPPFIFFEIYIYTILIAEGEEELCTVASLATFVVNVVLDFVLCKLLGVFGLGLATVLGHAASIPVLCKFFMREDRQLHFEWHWDFGKTARALGYSFYHSVDTLCLSILPLIMSTYVINHFDEDHIIVVTTVVNVLTLVIALYTGLVDCLQPMVCQYHAEGALWSVKKTMRIGMLATNAISLLVTVLGIIFASLLPRLFGVEDEAIIDDAAVALRIFLLPTIFLGATLMYANYYIYIERLNAGAVLKILLLLALPTVGMEIGGAFGLTGFWIGIAASFLTAFLIDWLWTRGNLLLMDDADLDRQLSYDIDVNFDEVMALTSTIDRDLDRTEFDVMKHNRIVMWVEELGLAAVDRADGKSFQMEISIVPDGNSIVMIVRDNGAPISDEVKSNLSFREHFIELMNVTLKDRRYLPSGDENRLVMKL